MNAVAKIPLPRTDRVRPVPEVRERSAEGVKVSPFLLNWFTTYSKRYIRKHFHGMRISKSGPMPIVADQPVVLYLNHPSWWDPLVGLVVRSLMFPNHTLFAPMDDEMLHRYKFFKKLGFFGVKRNSRQGAKEFLATSSAILNQPNNVLAITPQGQFADVRTRPLRFEAGLGHLAKRVERAVFVPMAVEYVFWQERLPEILIRFGEQREIRGEEARAFPSSHWSRQLEEELESAQSALAEEAQSREASKFNLLLDGEVGTGGIYEMWRRLKANLSGRTFAPGHES